MSFDKRDYLYIALVGLLISSVAFLPVVIIDKLNQQTAALNTLLNQTQYSAVIDRSVIQDTQLQILAQHGINIKSNGTHHIFTSILDNTTLIAIPDIDLPDNQKLNLKQARTN